MLLNEHTAIVGEKVILVPYRGEHVATYHQWMSSHELRELTASEELTLEEEYEMCEKWRVDDDKLTFIVLANLLPPTSPISPDVIMRHCPMIGDVNLFFNRVPLQAETSPDFDANDDAEGCEVEVEVMIAEPLHRRNGCAISALHIMLSYVTSVESYSNATAVQSRIPVEKPCLVARIGLSNEPSIRLFEKLGFETIKVVEVFGEVEMRFCKEQENEFRWEAGQEIYWP